MRTCHSAAARWTLGLALLACGPAPAQTADASASRADATGAALGALASGSAPAGADAGGGGGITSAFDAGAAAGAASAAGVANTGDAGDSAAPLTQSGILAGMSAGGSLSPEEVQQLLQMQQGAQALQMARWQNLQNSQTGMFTIQQDVTGNTAKSADPTYAKWDSYINNFVQSEIGPAVPPAAEPNASAASDLIALAAAMDSADTAVSADNFASVTFLSIYANYRITPGQNGSNALVVPSNQVNMPSDVMTSLDLQPALCGR